MNKLYLLFDERIAYNYGSGNNNGAQYRSHAVNAYVQAGMAYDIAKKMQLELLVNNVLSAGYMHSTQGDSYGIGTSLDGFSLSDVAFGFRYYLK